MNLSIAIPDSALSDEKTLENKTRKISSIARSCGIFRVNEIIIYRDVKKNESDLKLFVTILKYLETPQYFRKTIFGKTSLLKFVGALPPLGATPGLEAANLLTFKGAFLQFGLGDNTSTGTSGNVIISQNTDVDSASESLVSFAHATFRGAKLFISINNRTV